jgi:hypothetical protein
MSFATSLRAVPFFRAPGMTFGPSPMDRLVGNLRAALDQRDGYCPAYAQACAKLAWANRTKSEHRRANQATAFRAINTARTAARARAKAVVAARAALVAAGMALEQIAVVAPGGEA